MEILTSPGGGAVIAAFIVSVAGVIGYRWQKQADRYYDLVKLRQQEYERYLKAFQEASRWKPVDPVMHFHAESDYHNSQNYMLLHASAEVLEAVNAAHRYYVSTSPPDWRKFKQLYAEMIIAMRKAGYTPINLSVQEISENIPWTIGSEIEDKEREAKSQDSSGPPP